MKTVIKRDGSKKPFDNSKIKKQLEFAYTGLKENQLELEAKLTLNFKNNMKTSDIQDLLVSTATSMIDQDHPEMSIVAGRLSMYQLHRQVYKNTKFEYDQFDEYIKYAVRTNHYRKDIMKPFSEDDIKTIKKAINPKYDFDMNIAQVLSLRSKYILKNSRGVIEYPQFSDMASAMILGGIEDERERVHKTKEYFTMLQRMYISLATPFKANLRREGGNVGSCFIVPTLDNIESITKTWQDMAKISKEGGGIGVYLGALRPEGSSSNNIPNANNIVRWTKIINDIAVAVNQRGIRKGAITPALDWWHGDIHSFIEMKSETQGDLRNKCFDLFPQVVVDDYFVDAVLKNKDVYLFDSYEVKTKTGIDVVSLIDEELYEAQEKIYQLCENGTISNSKKQSAKALWKEFLRIWVETGDFYITHKDNLNLCNYLKGEDLIANSANLCTESFSITKAPTEWVQSYKNGVMSTESDGLYHSCNLLSINLGLIVNDPEDKLLKRVCYNAVDMMDASIETGTMPVKEAENSSKLLRNVGIGVLGTGDWMAYNKLSYEKPEDLDELEKVYEKIAWYCYERSVQLAEKKGAYPLFDKADYSKMFGKNTKQLDKESLNGFKWSEMSKKIQEKGIRNFLLLATAPNCQSGHNKMKTTDGNKSIYDILEEQNIDYRKIEELNVPQWIGIDAIKVPTLNGESEVNRIWYNGKQPVIEIEFEDGNTYEFTYNHKLLVYRNGEEIWIRCDELKEGDDIININEKQ